MKKPAETMIFLLAIINCVIFYVVLLMAISQHSDFFILFSIAMLMICCFTSGYYAHKLSQDQEKKEST